MTYPEGRQPIAAQDMAKLHPSTWAQEVEQLRARVATLEKRLADCVVWMDTREKIEPGMPRICDMARAALQQPTEPHTATHSAKSDTR